YRLTKETLGNSMDGLDMNSTPQTIKDATTVTRAMSLPYLWVDALCILQDSDEDKATEVSLMSSRYLYSVITIAAGCSDSVISGFLHNNTRRENKTCCLDLANKYTILYKVAENTLGTISLECLRCYNQYHEDEEPIDKRAWALQEQLIPCHLLLYVSHNPQWRCHNGTRNL
ncbi:hypothetical protein P154DRAFT_385144, partial [Amniculicola lignicola CBS 123094]